jgi:hypothetical protein
VQIAPYTEDLEAAVRSFKQRLCANGEQKSSFPETHRPRFPKTDGKALYQEFFLTVHAGAVRGGYSLTYNQFAVRGEEIEIACGPQYNLSEGIVNKTYKMVGAIQAQDALRHQPLMYALGMGGLEMPFPQLLKAMDWVLLLIPFYFRVLSPSVFLENITYLRNSPRKRLAVDLLRYSGLGSLGMRVAQLRLPRNKKSASSVVVESFGTWADNVWDTCRGLYSLVGKRDSSTLNMLYPPQDPRFVRLRVSSGNREVGWAVLLDTQMSNHGHFGNMRVGSIADCLAAPEDAACVVSCATEFLQRRGVDIIVTNQASTEWCSAIAANGYLKGPSNFVLALSPQLANRLAPLEEVASHIHMNRGDGEGPNNL